MDECWLCLRTTPEQVLEASHKLFPDDPKLAHRVGLRAASLLKETYLKNPPALCGRKTAPLIGAALYIASLLEDARVTQREAAEAVNVTETAIRDNYHVICRTLRILEDWPKQYRSYGTKVPV
jgi:transcription initiation factor TFIIIB Brf1 subunit/transcription initiation factor TFIIB